MSLIPRHPVPDLTVSTVGEGSWTLSNQTPENFSMIAFYRGLHCPICKKSLADLNRRAADFENAGVSVIAVSCDPLDRAETARTDWGLDNLEIGYGLSIESARKWGLYISSGRGVTSVGVEETALFCEPGLFVVRPDGILYMTAVQSMPFARPMFAEVLSAIQFIVDNDYPARGEA